MKISPENDPVLKEKEENLMKRQIAEDYLSKCSEDRRKKIEEEALKRSLEISKGNEKIASSLL